MAAVGEAKTVQQELNNLLTQEDLRWRQRAKAEWLKNGDRNTKFYHACANHWKKSNQIFSIKDEEGVLWESPEEVGQAFVDYFSGLFSAGLAGNLEPCLQQFEGRVSLSMNDELLKLFLREEVEQALYQMAPLKAPGPDGFSAGFFQTHWETTGDEVCRAVLDTLNSGIMPSFLNMTHIALIPKVKNPTCY